MTQHDATFIHHPREQASRLIFARLLFLFALTSITSCHSEDAGIPDVMLEGESIDSNSPRMRVLLELGAQEHGLDVGQYKQQLGKIQADKHALESIMPEFRGALLQDDTKVFTSILATLTPLDLPVRFPGIFDEIIKSDNIEFHEAALQSGIACRFNPVAGHSGLTAAVEHENPAFLALLLNEICDADHDDTFRIASNLIVRSEWPERILLLPPGKADQTSLNKALGASLESADDDLVRNLVMAGANIDHVHDKQTSLLFSVKNRRPQLAQWLLDNGASTSLSNEYVRSALLAALEARYDPVYLRLMNSGMDETVTGRHRYQLVTEAMSMTNPDSRLFAMSQLLEHGIHVSALGNLENTFIFQAAREEDMPLVQLLVESGSAVPAARNRRKLRRVIEQWQTTEQSAAALTFLEERGLVDTTVDADNVRDCGLGELIVNADPELFSGTSLPGYGRLADTGYTNDKACLASIANCVNSGEGADDCVRTVPLCTGSADRTGTFCCHEEMKKDYLAQRCSGKTVWDTFEQIMGQ